MAILSYSAFIVAVDQVTKLPITDRFYLGETYEALGSFVRFIFVQNPGIAFGLHFGSAMISSKEKTPLALSLEQAAFSLS
jgi:lipoprotein signal peptidase